MAEQVRHLVEATAAGTYWFGIVPAGTLANRFALHAVDVVESADSRLVHFGTHAGVVTVAGDRDQAEALAVLDEVRRIAVTGEAARAELDRLADLYR